MDKQTGVYEWARKSRNFQTGCEYNCRYCYARAMAVQYGRCTAEEWAYPVRRMSKVDAPHNKKIEGGVMFPSTHDITPKNLSDYLCVLHKLLDSGNQVLIVSKPNKECIKIICNTMSDYKDQIMFRFTIGSTDNKILKFWEPNAPAFAERIYSLRLAYDAGYATSVSCEPYLDAFPHYVYVACESYVTDSIWFGKLRQLKRRVDFSKISKPDYNEFVTPLETFQQDYLVLKMVDKMNGWPLVRWKDSVTEVIEKNRREIKDV